MQGCGACCDQPELLRKAGTAFRVTCFNAAAGGAMKGILAVSTEELVSSDYIGNPHSCILDSLSTNVVDGTMVKVSGWYDNEWGYANRCVDLIRMIGR